MKDKVIIVFLLMIPFLISSSTTSSFACSCVQPGSAVEELDRSDFVFSGKVKEIKDPNANSIVQSSADKLEIYFEVSKTWKGVNQTEVLVSTERDSASCGFNFSKDKEYIIYGNDNKEEKSVNLCSKTALLTEASADLVELGEGQRPSVVVKFIESTGGVESYTESRTMAIPITAFTVTVLIIIGIAYWIVQKEK